MIATSDPKYCSEPATSRRPELTLPLRVLVIGGFSRPQPNRLKIAGPVRLFLLAGPLIAPLARLVRQPHFEAFELLRRRSFHRPQFCQ